MLPYINRSANLYDDPASVQFHCKEQFLQNHKRLQEHAFGTLNSKILQHTTSSRRIHYNMTTDARNETAQALNASFSLSSLNAQPQSDTAFMNPTYIEKPQHKVPKMYIVTAIITLTATKATELHTLLARVLSAISPYRAWNNHKTQSTKTISTEKRCRKYCFQGISAFTWGSDQTILL